MYSTCDIQNCHRNLLLLKKNTCKSLCELAQAGCRNDDKTMDEMQRVYLFSLLCQLGDPEAAPGQRHTSGNAGTAELGPC